MCPKNIKIENKVGNYEFYKGLKKYLIYSGHFQENVELTFLKFKYTIGI
jgi:hypothetical protein